MPQPLHLPLGPVMVDLPGLELTDADRELLCQPAVGGVILFARNYATPEQLLALTTAIRALRSPPLLIAVDQEGGRVQRFRAGFQRLPPAGWYAQQYAHNPARAVQLAQRAGWLMASELLACGVDCSFAPVLDIDRGLCNVVGDRAFGSDAATVSTLAGAWWQGMRLAGMAAVGKHFPGHGGVTADSHLALPHDNRPFATLWEEDLLPFRTLLAQGLEAVMPAHVVYPQVDVQPAGFSAQWLQGVLRQRLGFDGAIFSDALDMAAAAAAGGFVERAQVALAAGCDQILVCNNRPAAEAVVQALAVYSNPAAQARLLRLYGRTALTRSQLVQHPWWQETVAVVQTAWQQAAEGYDPTTRGGTVV